MWFSQHVNRVPAPYILFIHWVSSYYGYLYYQHVSHGRTRTTIHVSLGCTFWSQFPVPTKRKWPISLTSSEDLELEGCVLSPKCKIITWISTVIPPSSLRADLLQQIQPLYDTQQLVQRPRRKQTLYKYFYFIVVVERSLLSFSWTVVDGVRDNEGAHHGLQRWWYKYPYHPSFPRLDLGDWGSNLIATTHQKTRYSEIWEKFRFFFFLRISSKYLRYLENGKSVTKKKENGRRDDDFKTRFLQATGKTVFFWMAPLWETKTKNKLRKCVFKTTNFVV